MIFTVRVEGNVECLQIRAKSIRQSEFQRLGHLSLSTKSNIRDKLMRTLADTSLA